MLKQGKNEKILTMKQWNNEIIKVLRYFSIFRYPPTEEEIYTFLKKKTSFGRFKSILKEMVKQDVIKSWTVEDRELIIDFRRLRMEDRKKNIMKSTLNALSSTIQPVRYTIGEYGIKKYQISKIKNQRSKSSNVTTEQWNNFSKKYKISINKLKSLKFKLYIKLLSFAPQIKLVGLSGSMAMMNAGKKDDIDLFVITRKNRLFTGRFIALLLAQLLCLRRKRNSGEKARYRVFSPPYPKEAQAIAQKQVFSLYNHETIKQWNNSTRDKVCLNLFFDELDLAVPKFKRCEYVAHEVLQMKPIINKSYTYEKFLGANRWVFRLFPNSKRINLKFKIENLKLNKNLEFKIKNCLGNKIELILKSIQLSLIHRHQTSENIGNTQLWFHPDDFRKKLKLK